MKTYSIGEAFKMLDENENLEFKSEEYFECKGEYSILRITSNGYYGITNYKKNGEEEEGRRKEFNGTISKCLKWELIQQPVTWNEVLESNKMVRIEHELIDINMFWDEELEELEDLGKFYELDDIMSLLSCRLDSESLKTVIKEGKWYLEQ